MSIIMTSSELVEKLKDMANNYKTLYVLGCFGAPMNAANKKRYCNELSYNRRPERTAMIQSASADTFGFDCVNLIKGLLWGWKGDKYKTYGGAVYKSNGVPDVDDGRFFGLCYDVSTDFSNIQVGEAVWMNGHIGVYVGDGLAVECTPKWKNGVQITAVGNIGTKSGYNSRKWTKHGKIPYVSYEIKKQEGEFEVKLTTLKKGARGDKVKALQALLIGYGYEMKSGNKVYGVDGSFGGATDRAVRKYQEDNNLEVDGSVGPATWAKLLGIK